MKQLLQANVNSFAEQYDLYKSSSLLNGLLSFLYTVSATAGFLIRVYCITL